MQRLTLVLIAFVAFASICSAQDSQSLGDLARQVRAQKEQRDAQAKDAASNTGTSSAQDANASPKASRVITNDDTASTQDVTPVMSKSPDGVRTAPSESASNHEKLGERWKAQILSQKQVIASMQNEIAQLSNSVHYAGENCLANCGKWNRRQQQKQERVESIKAQLEVQTHRLEEMQEAARKQGFGNAVYDP